VPLKIFAIELGHQLLIDNVGTSAIRQDTAVVRAGRQRLFVLHDISQLDIDPLCAGYGAVVFGHSHRPSAESRDGVLFLNQVPARAGSLCRSRWRGFK
jgi:predicted phosphodiesterase